ncbi:MAG: hypothetical protein KKC55_17115, partial [Gammaproteobacteria bacterium]|nr:hypothetical protein [Gammaproteobacteria bacterium]
MIILKMISLTITITEKGKRIANFSNELEKAMNQSMNKSLEFTRKTLAKNAPYRQYTANNPAPPVHNYHLRGYLKDPAKCVRRGRLGSTIIYGEIWFNEKWVPQIRH